jgi:hypothetical protein
LRGSPTLDLETIAMAHRPSRAEHNVTNAGKDELRYAHVAAIAEE